jgi:L-carnitine CoA-transferase
MMVKRTDIPKFGVLSGVNVVFSGISIAGPFPGTIMAEMGADVIWIENPKAPDPSRTPYGLLAVQDRRNERSLTLNVPSPEGREVFLRLMKKTDIFIEASRGKTLDGWGLDDETLWAANPALVIVHISGFGQSGMPEYIERASWDGIGQAFSGYMNINGYPDPEPPLRVGPYTCDYYTALFASTTALAALLKARQTGHGDSIDLAQYEVMLRITSDYPARYLNWGRQVKRNGNEDATMTGYYPYQCRDGKYLFTAFVGFGVLKGGLPLIGLEFGSADFPANMAFIPRGTPQAAKFDEKIKAFCAARTAEECEAEFNAAGVPCSPILDYEAAVNHPHYKARSDFMEWDDADRGHVKGVSPIPKFKKNPQQIWRGCPPFGEDVEDIMGELGYTTDEIAAFDQKGVIKKAVPKK